MPVLACRSNRYHMAKRSSSLQQIPPIFMGNLRVAIELPLHTYQASAALRRQP
jgi:hypothetical protein